ncbi:putative F-box protein At1g47790 [Triticum dicoccoides]|uniref:putative F-box protein At1g47790 n=1 Tax=Triticum dicoccoides TaxID=85692 RepID=UPI00162ED6F8|nr:putative F-box protein At1g47790 [Triticum dicoccoides]
MLLRSGRRLVAQEEPGRTASPRRRSRARSDRHRLAGIPDEILQQEILPRLPAKSVLRCRAVCRSWRSLASDPAFLLDHHRRQPALPLIRSCRISDVSGRGLESRLNAIHLRSAKLGPSFQFPFGGSFAISASCDGLFVVFNYIICNPATREWATLRQDAKRIENLIALFRHQPSGEFRVMYWRNNSMELICRQEYYMLTVGTNNSWRVDCPLTEVLAEEPSIFGAPVLLNGSLHIHWRRQSGVHYHRIRVFDTVAETSRLMIPPPVNPCHVMHLLDLGGKLAASTSNDGMTGMSIFVLQDPEHDVWSFQYRIKLPVMEIRRFQEQGDWWAKVVSEEGDVLVSCCGHLLQCDKKGNLVAKFKYDDDMPMVIPHKFKESLIQHTFFQKTKNKN